MSRSVRTSPNDRLLRQCGTAGLLAVVWGALAFGSVYPWAYAVLAVVCISCGVLGLLQDGVRDAPGRWILWALGLIAVAVGLQLIPLPIATVRALSPHTDSIVRELDIAVATGSSDTHPLSIAAPSTGIALTLLCSLIFLLIGVSRYASLTNPQRFLEAIALLGAVMAMIGIIQKKLFVTEIYGFWTPIEKGADPFGPFVNKNHFAGWMVMGLSVTLGLLCAQMHIGMRGIRPTWRNRILWFSSPAASRLILTAGATVLMALSLALTLSRSGILALIAAVSIAGWFAVRRLPGISRRVVAGFYLVALVATIVTSVGMATIQTRWINADRDSTFGGRLPIWQDSLRIAQDFWLTGTGVNTFGTATLFYQTAYKEVHFQQAHNEYLQLAAEGGLLVGLPILGAVGVFVAAVRTRFREKSDGLSYWIRLGAVTGIAAIALQSVFEFSLQMPGNAALFAVLCGLALHSADYSQGF